MWVRTDPWVRTAVYADHAAPVTYAPAPSERNVTVKAEDRTEVVRR